MQPRKEYRHKHEHRRSLPDVRRSNPDESKRERETILQSTLLIRCWRFASNCESPTLRRLIKLDKRVLLFGYGLPCIMILVSIIHPLYQYLKHPLAVEATVVGVKEVLIDDPEYTISDESSMFSWPFLPHQNTFRLPVRKTVPTI